MQINIKIIRLFYLKDSIFKYEFIKKKKQFKIDGLENIPNFSYKSLIISSNIITNVPLNHALGDWCLLPSKFLRFRNCALSRYR